MNEVTEIATQHINSQFIIKYERHDIPFVSDDFFNLNLRRDFLTIAFYFHGEIEFLVGNEKGTLPEKTVMIAKPNCDFFVRNKCTLKHEMILIRLHRALLSKFEVQLENSLDFLYSQSVLKTEGNTKLEVFNALMLSLKDCVVKHYKTEEIEHRLFCILSELSNYFANENRELKSDNLVVSMVDYVDKHFTEKLTVALLQEKFFVSPATIMKAFKLMTGKTFYKYLTYLRLQSANSLLKTLPAAKAAQVSGFETYSSFYREYKKYYNTTPKNGKTGSIGWPNL